MRCSRSTTAARAAAVAVSDPSGTVVTPLEPVARAGDAGAASARSRARRRARGRARRRRAAAVAARAPTPRRRARRARSRERLRGASATASRWSCTTSASRRGSPSATRRGASEDSRRGAPARGLRRAARRAAACEGWLAAQERRADRARAADDRAPPRGGGRPALRRAVRRATRAARARVALSPRGSRRALQPFTARRGTSGRSSAPARARSATCSRRGVVLGLLLRRAACSTATARSRGHVRPAPRHELRAALARDARRASIVKVVDPRGLHARADRRARRATG